LVRICIRIETNAYPKHRGKKWKTKQKILEKGKDAFLSLPFCLGCRMAEAGQEEPKLGLNTGKDGAGHLVAAHMVGMMGGTCGRRARHRLRFGAWVERKKSAKCTQ
jgi:hypothetical protein